MRHQAIKVRLYPTVEQQLGCSGWWWNHALNWCIETYQKTGKGLTQIALNKLLLPNANTCTELCRNCPNVIF